MTAGRGFNSHYLLIRCLLVVVLIEYSNGGNGKCCDGGKTVLGLSGLRCCGREELELKLKEMSRKSRRKQSKEFSEKQKRIAKQV
jgi:hypothetical protein